MTDRRASRLVLRVAVALGFAVLGCNDTDRSPLFGSAPTHAPLLLANTSAEVHGAPRTHDDDDAAGASLHSWLGDEVLAWRRDVVGATVRFTSPSIGTSGLAGAGTLRVRLRPGGATRVIVIPWVRGTQVDVEQRMLRRIELALERDADGDAAVDIELDLHEAIHGNFGDAGRDGRLEKLEIALPDARADAAALLAVVLRDRNEKGSGAAAEALIAEHDGVLRPSWLVRGGGSARFDVAVPVDSPELRWHDAALRETGERIIEVIADGRTQELSRLPATKGDLGAPWQLQRVSLARFSGQQVTLQLRVEGDGAGLFGEPRVASTDGSETRADVRAPDVIVYLIDTLRADKLGFAGNPAPASPTIDRLAKLGVAFELAQSSSPWTKPAIATLMSGILPNTHRVGASTYTDRMPPGVPLLQERFRKAGWRTGSFSASPLGSTLSALERGFGAAYPPRFFAVNAELAMNPSASQLHEALLAWIEEEPDEPFFAYVHTLEVHEWKLARYQRDLPAGFTSYDAAILDADRQLGSLLDALTRRATERDRDLLLVVVSDHGESWGDHDLPSHGFGLFQSQIHIPLVFWSSRGRLDARTVPAPVSLADLAPTLLQGFGLPPLDAADGRSLTGYFDGQPPEDRPVLSSLLRFVWAPRAPKQFAVTMPGRVKLIRSQGIDRAFDLAGDPGETQQLADGGDDARSALDRLLAEQDERAAAFSARYGASEPGAVTVDATERLRALGYLDAPDANSDPDVNGANSANGDHR